MIKNKALFSIAAGAFLAGCAVGPDYQTPAHELPAQFADAAAPAAHGQILQADWWRSFNDERLNQLIDDAVQGNQSVAEALAHVNQARALRQETTFDLLPTVTANGGYTKSRESTALIPGAFPGLKLNHEVYTAGGDATWELDLFGRVRREVEQSRAGEEAAIAELQDALRIVLADIATNYFSLRGNQTALQVAHRNVDSQAETLRLTEAQASSGMISDLDVARARAQLNGTLATIPPLEANVMVAIHRLAVLTGRNPETLESDLKTGQALPRYEGAVSLGDPASLLLRRPDVRAAERRLAAATAGVGVAEGDLFPKVTFNGTLAFEATSVSKFGNSGTDAYAFGPQIFWPAFDIGRVIARVHGADAQMQAVAAQYQQSVLTALEEVENALARFSAERARRDYLKEAAAQSAKAAQLAQFRYKEGSSDFLTVLDAQRTQLLAEASLNDSETQLSIDLVAIYKALGGGWETVDAKVRT